MSRPTPRKSSLAGSSPIAPPAPPAQVEQGEEVLSIPRKRKPGPRPKVSFYQDPEDTARVRGAHLHTMVMERRLSLSEFIHEAVMAEVERLEVKYNDGEPFPSVGAGGIPQGRPMGE